MLSKGTLHKDLTQLDSFGLDLRTNDDVIAVDQSGQPGQQISTGPDGQTPTWAARQPATGEEGSVALD